MVVLTHILSVCLPTSGSTRFNTPTVTHSFNCNKEYRTERQNDWCIAIPQCVLCATKYHARSLQWRWKLLDRQAWEAHEEQGENKKHTRENKKQK